MHGVARRKAVSPATPIFFLPSHRQRIPRRCITSQQNTEPHTDQYICCQLPLTLIYPLVPRPCLCLRILSIFCAAIYSYSQLNSLRARQSRTTAVIRGPVQSLSSPIESEARPRYNRRADSSASRTLGSQTRQRRKHRRVRADIGIDRLRTHLQTRNCVHRIHQVYEKKGAKIER